MITASELESIAFRCDGLQSIAHVYEEVQAIRPNADATELKRLFLDCLEELLRQGRVKFLGEGWIRDGSSVDSPLMFGDQYFDAADEVVNGLRQPIDSTPKLLIPFAQVVTISRVWA
jgi:hypothetical protein